MDINTYFDKIICINLNKRADRWSEMTEQFKKHSLNVLRFEAVDGNPMGWRTSDWAGTERSIEGALGCIASHVAIYKMAKENNWKRVLIVEDDCDFVDNLCDVFEKSITALPDDWDFLYFGGVHETRGGQFVPEKINEHFVRAKRIITTSCYAISNSVIDLSLSTILKDEPVFNCPIDAYLGAYIQPHCKTYAFHPPLAWQRASYSDIQKGHRDYSNMMRYKNTK
mgnify:CR=1 FL=1